jgi:hypothetical protein
MSNIINDNDTSYESILLDLTSYVQSLTDYQTVWRDFYESGAGSTILELISGLGTFLRRAAMANRRETYLEDAKLTSSIMGISSTIGYNINRQGAPQLSITLFSNNYVNWSKSDAIGFYAGNSLSLVQDAYLIPGNNTVTVALGQWNTYTTTSTSSDPFIKILINGNVDNTLYTLLVNGNTVSIVSNAEELTSSNVLMKTYYYGVYLIFGNNILGLQLNQGDTIVFNYFSPSSQLTDLSFNPASCTLNTGSLTSGSIISYGNDQDSNAKLVAVAPGYFSTRRRLITLSDYKYIALSYAGIISTYPIKQPGICCAINLAYLTDNQFVLSSLGKTAFLNYMNSFQVIGTTITLIDPIVTTVSASLLMVIQPTANISAITTSVTNYLNSMVNQLGVLFSVNGIFSLNLPGVLRIYFNYPINDYQAVYNQYFTINNVDIQFTTDQTTVGSMGTNTNIGYITNGTQT